MIQLTNEYLDSVWWKYIEAPDVVMAMGKEGFRSAVKEILSKNITLSPISVEESLPTPKDCDTEGRCWWFNPGNPVSSNPHTSTSSWRLTHMITGKPMGTHWYPAHKFSLPNSNV